MTHLFSFAYSRRTWPDLLVHGTVDMRVPYEQSRRMREALRKVGVQVVAWMSAHLRTDSRP